MKNIAYYLAKAAQIAEKGIKKGEGGPFGALILKAGRVLSVGHNTVLKTNDPTCHAEINAIRKASKKKKTPFFHGATIITTTEPCPMCFSAIHWAQFSQVVYSTTIQDVRKLGFNELTIPAAKMKKWGKSKILIQRIKNQECINLLKTWKKLPKKKTY